MKKIFHFSYVLFFTAFLFISQLSLAQESEPCGFNTLLEEQMLADPSFKAYVDKFNRDFTEMMRNNPRQAGERLPIRTIPLVFHIMHVGEAEGVGSNISDAQVESTVEGLNIHFRNMKADGSAFHPAGVDAEIEFCLAQVDPNGNATTGIRRVDMSGNSAYAADGVGNPGMSEIDLKRTPNFWDNTDYYNVWSVYKIDGGNQGGTQGYALFAPPGQNTRDGTVLLFNACGYDPDGSKGHNLKSYTRDGGTMTHEVGHALNLYHTFQGDQGGGTCPAANGCGADGDCLDDTVPHKGNRSSCNLPGTNACYGNNMAPTIYNWMDYSSCPDRFSQDGVDRMRLAFEPGQSARSNYTATKCIPVYANDAEIIDIKYPGGGRLCSESFDGVFTLKNRGANVLTSVDIEYYVDSDTPQIYNWTGNLITGTTTEVTLPSYTTTAGVHTFYVNSTNPNGTTDDFTGNDSKNTTIEIISGTEVHLRITLANRSDFESWEIVQGGTVFASGSYAPGQLGVVVDEYICLPNECFKFKFTNIYGARFGSSTYTLKDDQGNVMASGYDYYNAAGNPYTEETDFCVPFDPGFIHAKFKADKTIIASGTIVQFTDQSYSSGTPAEEWAWDFNDATIENNLQNPTHPFTTEGLYDITLGVANKVGGAIFDRDTLTKKAYIKVYDPVTSCTILNNKIASSEPTPITTVPGTWGYFAGHNGKNITGYSDVHFSNGTSNIVALDVSVEKLYTSLPNNSVTFNVYGNNNGLPDGILASQSVKLADLVIGNNSIVMDNPYSVSGLFYVGYEIDYTYPDTLVVGSAQHRGTDEYNSMFALENGNWKTVSNVFGSDARSSLDISVKLSYIPTPVIQMETNILCVGSPVLFDGRPSIYETSYNWDFDNGTITSGSNTSGFGNVKFDTSGTKQIKLTVTGGCAISRSDSITIEVIDSPDITLNAINESCDGNNGSITADVVYGSGNYSYLWDDPQSQLTQTAVQLSGPRTYEVRVTDGVCPPVFESIAIVNQATLPAFTIDAYHTSCGDKNGTAVANPIGGTGNYSYLWDDGQGQTTKSATGLQPGTYTVFVNDGQCPTASQTVTINGSVPVFAEVSSSTDSLCEQETVLLTAAGGTSYIWENSFGQNIGVGDSLLLTPNYTDTYTVFAFLGNCVGEASVDVSVTTKPKAFASVNGQTISAQAYRDEGGRANFSSSGSYGTGYFWDYGDGNNSYIKNPQHFYAEAGTYTVTLTVAIGNCTEIYTLTVVVSEATITTSIAGGNVEICTGEIVNLTAIGGESFVWNDGTEDFATTSEINVQPTVTTTYTVIASDYFGNTATDNTTITLFDDPIIKSLSTLDTVWVEDGGIADFEIDPSSNGVSYSWDFGNSVVTNGESATFAYTIPGKYTVLLSGYTANNCYEEEEVTVIVRSSIDINEYDAALNNINIYPNPSNGIFYINTTSNQKIDLQVLNLQGQVLEMLSIEKQANQWQVDLSQQADGVYFVKITSNNHSALRRITLHR
ncbi:MAG: PKD repeat protein [Flavobacteriales bacterium]|jgi:PKD repeat protein